MTSPMVQKQSCTACLAGSVGVGVFCAGGAAVVLEVGLHELESVFARHDVDAADAVGVRHSVYLVRLPDDLHTRTGHVRTFDAQKIKSRVGALIICTVSTQAMARRNVIRM